MTMTKKILLLLFVPIIATATVIPGGWTKQDVEDKTIRALSTAVIQEYDKSTNSPYGNRLVHIISASSQVVAGIKYEMKLEIGQTNCRKNEDLSQSKCGIHKKQICKFTTLVQPWMKQTMQLIGTKCDPQENRATVGGKQETEPMHENTLDAAEFSIKRMNEKSNSLFSSILLDVSTAHKQVVAGIKYNLKLTVGQSSCRKTADNLVASRKQCPLSSPNVIEECDVEVMDQAWRNPRYEIRHTSCSPIHRPKHHVQPGTVGGSLSIHDSLEMFDAFQKKFGKQYSNLREEVLRFHTFLGNMVKAAKLQESEKGSAKYGPTKFADITESEFRKNHLTPEWPLTPDPDMAKAEIPQEDIPAAFDWRDHNAVTEVKNQGSCGSCWAFSTTGNIEGQWAILKKKLESLSEQELVDCDKLDQGCNGGLPSNAYKSIMKLGGLESEKDYPYEGAGKKCSFQKKEVDVYINSSVVVSSDETDMAKWLVKNGPISIGINANAMQFYMGGVSHPFSFLCNPSSLDHGVLIVGYGVSKGWLSNSPYWIVKNSWGPDWGEKGYYLVYRGAGVCGLNKMPTSAVIKN